LDGVYSASSAPLTGRCFWARTLDLTGAKELWKTKAQPRAGQVFLLVAAPQAMLDVRAPVESVQIEADACGRRLWCLCSLLSARWNHRPSALLVGCMHVSLATIRNLESSYPGNLGDAPASPAVLLDWTWWLAARKQARRGFD
jgi:hypothetical protein